MTKFKILYLTFHPEIGGGETILLSLLTKLDKKIFEPTVVVTKKGQLSKTLEKLKIQTYILNLSPYLIRTLFIPGMSPASIFQFFKLAGKIKPDLIHINHLNLAVYAGIYGKLRKVPIVATAHGSWDSIYIYQDFISNFLIDKILTNTSALKTQLEKKAIIKPQKIDVVHFGVDTSKFKPATTEAKKQAKRKFDFGPNDFVVTIVGRLDPTKDHLTFLKAALIVQKKLKNAKFFIVGSEFGNFSTNYDYQNQINSFLKNHSTLIEKICFGGFIDSMPQVYDATDILVSTSKKESFGLALAEGAACGLPIVATVGGIIVKNNQNGFLVQPQNPKVIAQKILTLAANSKLRKTFGKNSRKYTIGHLQLQPYITKIEDVYLSLLSNQLESKRS